MLKGSRDHREEWRKVRVIWVWIILIFKKKVAKVITTMKVNQAMKSQRVKAAAALLKILMIIRAEIVRVKEMYLISKARYRWGRV